MIIDELITLLTFDTDASGISRAEKFRELMKNLAEETGKINEKIRSTGKKIGEYFRDQFQASNDIYEWARANDASTESAQRLGAAAVAMGGTIQDAQEDLANYNLLARQMGITVEDLLIGWAHEADRMTGTTKKFFLESRIQNAQLRNAMLEGGEAFEELIRNASVSTSGQLQSSHAVTMSWRELTKVFDETMRAAATEATPVLKELAYDIINFMRANREMIRNNVAQFFIGLATVLGDLSKVVVRFVGWIAKWLNGLKSINKGMLSLSLTTKLIKVALAALLALNIVKWGSLVAANFNIARNAGRMFISALKGMGKLYITLLNAHPILATLLLLAAALAHVVFWTRKTEGTQRGLANVMASLKKLGDTLMRTVLSPMADLIIQIGSACGYAVEKVEVGDKAISSWEKLGIAIGICLTAISKTIDAMTWLLNKLSQFGEAVGEYTADKLYGGPNLSDLRLKALNAKKEGKKTIMVQPNEIPGAFKTMIGPDAGMPGGKIMLPVDLILKDMPGLNKGVSNKPTTGNAVIPTNASVPSAPTVLPADKGNINNNINNRTASNISNSGNTTINVYAPDNTANGIARSVAATVRGNNLLRSQSSLMPV